MQALD